MRYKKRQKIKKKCRKISENLEYFRVYFHVINTRYDYYKNILLLSTEEKIKEESFDKIHAIGRCTKDSIRLKEIKKIKQI